MSRQFSSFTSQTRTRRQNDPSIMQTQRIEKSITQEAFGVHTRIPQQLVSKIERRRITATKTQRQRIAAFMQMPEDLLFDGIGFAR